MLQMRIPIIHVLSIHVGFFTKQIRFRLVSGFESDSVLVGVCRAIRRIDDDGDAYIAFG